MVREDVTTAAGSCPDQVIHPVSVSNYGVGIYCYQLTAAVKVVFYKLIEAVKSNSTEELETLLIESKAKRKEKVIQNALRLALNVAIQEHHTTCVQLLLKSGVEPYGIFKATEYGHADILELLLEYGLEPSQNYAGGDTALHVAVKKGHANCVQVLMNHCADPTVRNMTHESPLTIAVNKGKLDLLLPMLSHPKARSHRDTDQRTLLHLACRNGDIPIVEGLLNSGCNPNIVDSHCHTPLIDAVLRHHIEVVKCLLPRCDVNFPGQRNATAVIYAAQINEAECLRALLEAGACVNEQDIMGNTALIMGGPYCNVIEMLLSYAADPDIQNHFGMTALWYAAYYHYVDVFKILLRANSNPDLKGVMEDEFHTSALEIAYKRGHFGICKMVVYSGINASHLMRLLSAQRFGQSFAESLAKWTKEWHIKPRSLMHLSRIAVRQAIGNVCLARKITALPLPKQLKDYLNLNDLESVITDPELLSTTYRTV